MVSPSAPPDSPREESPPPYSSVVECSPPEYDDGATQTGGSHGQKAAVIYAVLSLGFVIMVVMGCITGDLWMQLNRLKVTVEEHNTREVDLLKLRLDSLAINVHNISNHNEEVMTSLEMLADKVDRLRLKKDGELHYVMVAGVNPLQPDVRLLLVLSVPSLLAARR